MILWGYLLDSLWKTLFSLLHLSKSHIINLWTGGTYSKQRVDVGSCSISTEVTYWWAASLGQKLELVWTDSRFDAKTYAWQCSGANSLRIFATPAWVTIGFSLLLKILSTTSCTNYTPFIKWLLWRIKVNRHILCMAWYWEGYFLIFVRLCFYWDYKT